MEYFLSLKCQKEFGSLIKEAAGIVENRMGKGFFPWLLRTFGKEFYDVKEQFDLPLFFLMEDELGKEVPAKTFQSLDGESEYSCMNYIIIPSSEDFEYKNNVKYLENYSIEGEEEERYLMEYNESSDFYGIYYTLGPALKSIFIRIEKIKNDHFLSNPFGLASIVLHELSHVLMSTDVAPVLKVDELVSSQELSRLVYYLEECLANLITFRTIKGTDIPKETFEKIIDFMENQPKPYALGIKMGKAELTKYKSLDFIIQSYVLNWYKAKYISGDVLINDIDSWFKMINSPEPFTDIILKEQIKTLFVL